MQDDQYIEGLIQEEDKILKAIYQNFAGRISHYILKNGGSAQDAKDVFQDALMIVLEKAQSPGFKLSSSFYTYLFSVNKLVWYNLSRKKSRKDVTIPDDNTLKDDYNIEQDLINRELDNIYRTNFLRLGELCRQLLSLFFERKTMTEIAQQLKLKNEHTARTRKYRCQANLKKLMELDKRYLDWRNKL